MVKQQLIYLSIDLLVSTTIYLDFYELNSIHHAIDFLKLWVVVSIFTLNEEL